MYIQVIPAATSAEDSIPSSRESWTPEAKADCQGDERKAPDYLEPPRRSNTHVGSRTVPACVHSSRSNVIKC